MQCHYNWSHVQNPTNALPSHEAEFSQTPLSSQSRGPLDGEAEYPSSHIRMNSTPVVVFIFESDRFIA